MLSSRLTALAALTMTIATGNAAGAATSLKMVRACEPAERRLSIASIGDILPHTGLAEQSLASREGFASLWTKVTPWLKAADLTYGNLEGPAAYGVSADGANTKDPGPRLDGRVYTSTNMVFNFHPRIIGDLKRSGFDVISTANNHALDRWALGVDRTIDAFREEELTFVGTRRAGERGSWSKIVEAKGFRIAYVACTETTNGMPDKKSQVLFCFKNADEIQTEIRRLAQDRAVDAIIVTPHWGVEYQHQQSSSQTKLARLFLEAGATAIIGSHPHVMQPMEKYTTRDGRETVIAYSLGNFVSGQGRRIGQKLTAIVYLGLSSAGGRTWINGVRYLPVWMDRGPHVANLLESTNQAPSVEAYKLIRNLFDQSRELKRDQAIVTNPECVRK